MIDNLPQCELVALGLDQHSVLGTRFAMSDAEAKRQLKSFL